VKVVNAAAVVPPTAATAAPSFHTGSAVTSETRYLSADDPTGEFKVVLPRVQVSCWRLVAIQKRARIGEEE
jgi:hypothetical protein